MAFKKHLRKSAETLAAQGVQAGQRKNAVFKVRLTLLHYHKHFDGQPFVTALLLTVPAHGTVNLWLVFKGANVASHRHLKTASMTHLIVGGGMGHLLRHLVIIIALVGLALNRLAWGGGYTDPGHDPTP
jgi:hypothetical protein